jgi:hypothetical protein
MGFWTGDGRPLVEETAVVKPWGARPWARLEALGLTATAVRSCTRRFRHQDDSGLVPYTPGQRTSLLEGPDSGCMPPEPSSLPGLNEGNRGSSHLL